jgi:hypothetical protein
MNIVESNKLRVTVSFSSVIEKWDYVRFSYHVTVTNKLTKQKTSFKFYGSYYQFKLNTSLNLSDVVECMLNDYLSITDVDTYQDFSHAFGYDKNKNSYKVYQAQKRLAKNLNRVINSHEDIEELEVILNG